MKPVFPHDPLDDLIAAALHGDLSPQERAQFEARLNNDAAARAAYLEAQAMHDLLEKTHRSAQPDTDFEQRMVSGVRRKLNQEKHRETAWESVLVLWRGLKRPLRMGWIAGACVLVALMIAGGMLYQMSDGDSYILLHPFATIGGVSDRPTKLAKSEAEQMKSDEGTDTAGKMSVASNGYVAPGQIVLKSANDSLENAPAVFAAAKPPSSLAGVSADSFSDANAPVIALPPASTHGFSVNPASPAAPSQTLAQIAARTSFKALDDEANIPVAPIASNDFDKEKVVDQQKVTGVDGSIPSPATPQPAPEVTDGRKLIRNAQLDLEVKSYQGAVDQITALTKSAGGYVDSSNSQKGGNGKLQGTVVVKILPENLDGFLLKLRDLGTVNNQQVSTDDVTKEYVDTQARLDNSRRMETQLQDLLVHQNSKVSDLLQVERELERVRGDIEQMQGQLKLYDFEVQYATVTISLGEKDLNQAAAYILKEMDDFTLYSTDVEDTFEKSKKLAGDFKAEILVASLTHNSPSDISALVVVSVPPEQIEPFLDHVRTLGRVDNFTRNTKREAKDGGDTDDPADETRTDRDNVLVNLSIHPDDDSRKQVALTVVAKAVDDALDQAKSAALAQAGTEILSSSLNKTPEGASTAQLSVRVPGKEYTALLGALQGLGRTASLSIQRNDSAGPGANGDDEPVIVALSLTDDDTPLQHTELSVLANDVDGESSQIKQQAAAAGAEIKASSYERQPDGTETAQLTFRLPMAAYPAFLENVKKLGKVESLTVQRDDRPDQTQVDDTAPVEIALTLHNQGQIVPDNSGIWPTLRETFGDGAGALFGSVKTIGVLVAFLTPWVMAIGFIAWVGRRIYILRKK